MGERTKAERTCEMFAKKINSTEEVESGVCVLCALRKCKETVESTRLCVRVVQLQVAQSLSVHALRAWKGMFCVLPVTSALCRGFQSSRNLLSREQC